jgi:hypothetical protein
MGIVALLVYKFNHGRGLEDFFESGQVKAKGKHNAARSPVQKGRI